VKGIGALLALIASIFLAPDAMAQFKNWDELVAAAKKEGVVVVSGSPDPVMRNEIVPKFTARFGVKVEFLAGRTGEIVARTRMDRAAGLFTMDVYLAGSNTALNVLYAEKMVDPLRPLLIMPEVADGGKWKRGSLWFIDPEDKYLLALFYKIGSEVFVNTDHVKLEELKSVKDLLSPKFTGKLGTEDPSDLSGAGGSTAMNYYRQLGPDFVKKLYVGQKPGISRSRRQLADWLARGTYPICLTCRNEDARQMQDEGFKIAAIYEMDGLQGHASNTPFLLSIANKPAHPAAAQLFANWMAGREALETYSRGHLSATLRNDVDESFLDSRSIPRPGVTYIDDSDARWQAEKPDIGEKLKALLK
jgi:ABC-type Fe3+ transport system substrate-binding protein